jgi:hypothetical protein
MCRLIFLGPSLDLKTARAHLGDAVYLPPLRQADLLSAIHRYHPSAIGIIDGYFLQDLSVWHKEILYALRRGISVYGASSMGALRAAEMSAFGMRGIGNVYRAFAGGSLVDDDEVALAHAPEELDYEKHSEPMVNVRATLNAALEQKRINAAVCSHAIEAAKSVYFPERSLARLSRLWRECGFTSESAAILDDILRNQYVDLKRQDAIELLKTMAGVTPTTAETGADLPPHRTIAFDTLEHRDRRSDTGVELSKVFRYAAIHAPHFDQLQWQALNRTLAALLAANLGFAASPEQIEEESRRFRSSNRIRGQQEFLNWLRESDLTEEAYASLMSEQATVRLVQQWWLSVSGQPGLRAKLALDELRLNGGYRAMAQAAANLAEQTAEELIPDVNSWSQGETADALRRHAQRTGFRLDIPVQRWARETGYFSYSDLLADVYLANLSKV